MTENEAIEIINLEKQCVLRNIKGCDRNCKKCDLLKADKEILEGYDMAISALKEIQQYREIGTVEECREAVEKQKAKKPEVIDQDFDYYKCPVCGEYIWATDNINDHKYCLNCGQAVTL